jgi:hypothetical protein
MKKYMGELSLRSGQRGWALPLVLVLSAILLTLGVSLALLFKQEIRATIQAKVADASFTGSDDAKEKAINWLSRGNWDNIGYGNFNCLTCPAAANKELAGVQYYISITAGDLEDPRVAAARGVTRFVDVYGNARLLTNTAGIDPSLWPNAGDIRFDRTIFVRVVETNVKKESRYYGVVHRDNICRATFADPITAVNSIDLGDVNLAANLLATGGNTGGCYNQSVAALILTPVTTTTAIATPVMNCCPENIVAGGTIASNVACLAPKPSSMICSTPFSTPASACIVPSLANTATDFAFPTPTSTPTLGGPTLTPTRTHTTGTIITYNYPLNCFGASAPCGKVALNSGAYLDAYNFPTPYSAAAATYGGGVYAGGGLDNLNVATLTAMSTPMINGPLVQTPCISCTPYYVPTPTAIPTGMMATVSCTGVAVNVVANCTIGSSDLQPNNNCGASYAGGGQSITLGPNQRYWIFNSIQVNNNCQLIIDDTNGPVFVWVKGSFTIDGNFVLKNGPPQNFQIFCEGNSVNINSTSTFQGFIYAPGANITVNKDMIGGVLGKTVTLNSGGKIHYPNLPGGGCSAPPQSVVTTPTNTPTLTATPTITPTPVCPGSVSSMPKILWLASYGGTQVYRCKAFHLADGVLEVDVTNGPVELVVDSFDSIASSTSAFPVIRTIPPYQANKFTIKVVGSGVVNLDTAGKYTMRMWAPGSTVQFTTNVVGSLVGSFYGALFANQINKSTTGAMNFYFTKDPALNINDYFAPPVIVKGWRRY